MGDDILERLRYEAWRNPSEGETADAHYLAADALAEIERLRAERDAERELADQLASHLEWALRCVGSLPMELRVTFDARTAEVVAAYEEARRG